jgi:Type II secretory pathway, prepilin signal peptidase PulO and related peptidases
VALAVVDIAVHRLPDQITLASYPLIGGLIAASSLLLRDGEAALRALLGLLGYGGLLLLLALPPGGIGLGDVKLAGLLGGLLAWIEWSALARGALIAVLLAGGFALVLLASRRAGRHSHMPLGPFMVAGALLALLGAGTPATT